VINLAILRKTLVDSAATIGMSAVGLVMFVVLFVWAMLNMGTELMEFVSKFPFIRTIMKATLGIDVSGEISANLLFAVCFTHGVVLSLTWGVIIAIATRVTAGEVERGTADFLYTLPVSRPQVFASTSIAWFSAALFLSFCPVIGIAIAMQLFETDEGVEVGNFVIPAVNFFFLNVSVGGIATLVGSVINRRGQSVGIVVGIIIVSVVLNFVEPFIPAIERIRFLGLLNYFRPVDVVRLGEWPLSSMTVLGVLGLVSWSAAVVIFWRKDIPTG